VISTQNYYKYDDLKVGVAVACVHNGKKFVGIITKKEFNFFEIFWEGNSEPVSFIRYSNENYSGCFVLLKDYKKYKELMK
jgi:hypothetical protein